MYAGGNGSATPEDRVDPVSTTVETRQNGEIPVCSNVLQEQRSEPRGWGGNLEVLLKIRTVSKFREV
jgi:hypothetical protein